MRRFIRPSIGLRLAALFLAMMAIGIGAILVAEDAFDRHAELAQFVNQTGRLRMLSQNVAYQARRLADKRAAAHDLAQAVVEFRNTLAAVAERAARFGAVDRATLADVQDEAKRYLAVVERLAQAGGSRPAAERSLGEIEEAADKLLGVEEAAMASIMERHAEERRKLRFDLFSLLLLGLVVTGIAYWRVRDRIVAPIARMADMARRFAAGNLAARVRYEAGDELGELARTLDRTAADTERLLAKYRETQRAVESIGEGVMISDARDSGHPATYVNPAFGRITGYASADVVGRNARFLLGDDLAQPGIEALRGLLREERDGTVVLCCYRKDGSPFWNELSVSPVRDDGGRVTHTISIFKDVSDRIRQEEELLKSAHHDALTGLANRTLLQDRLKQALSAAHRHDRQVGVLFVDIDNFKLINDSLGHDAGDQLLQETAQRLSGCLREGDTVARVGGDEFVLLLSDMEHEDHVAMVAERVLAAMVTPFAHRDGGLFVSASIGAAFYPRDGEDGATLMKHADIAMYRAKERGRNNFQVFTEEMQARIDRRLSLETHLRRALERDEFELYYQPQVNLASGRVVGAEALIRWHHPEMGLVPPAQFIPLAEETGLIVPIGEWVLDAACAQVGAWRLAGTTPICVAVNLSARQFRQSNLVRVVEQSLRMQNVGATHLELEMTESMVMQDPEQTIHILRQLKEIGMRLSLDDFGTGYSSLSHLRRFPIDVLKVDQSFVRDVTTNPDDAAITASIIALAHSLQLEVIAEGVETQAQLHYLKRQHCDIVQGYYFSHPLPAAELTAMLAAEKRLSDDDLLRAPILSS